MGGGKGGRKWEYNFLRITRTVYRAVMTEADPWRTNLCPEIRQLCPWRSTAWRAHSGGTSSLRVESRNLITLITATFTTNMTVLNNDNFDKRQV